MANSRARKGELGFQGFVQSDWWAVHEPSFVQGLDQEMPGQATELFLSPSNTSQHPQRVDEAATRILAAMYKVNLHETGMVAGHVFWPSSHFITTCKCIYIYICYNLYFCWHCLQLLHCLDPVKGASTGSMLIEILNVSTFRWIAE